MEKLKSIYPGRERSYFALALIAAVLFVVATPLSAPDFQTVKDEVIESQAGSFDAAGIQGLLSQAQATPEGNDSAEIDALRQKLDDRMRKLDPKVIHQTRNLFLGGSEQVYPMPPLDLGFPTIPSVPMYDLPIGDIPALQHQNRPTLKDEREVKLLREEGVNPFDFDKNRGGE